MLLVVPLHVPVGMHKIETVIEPPVCFRCDASGDGTISLRCLTLHPLQRIASLRFGHPFGIGTETGGKHIGQHDEVCPAATVYHFVCLPHIRGRICPADVGLQYECFYVHVFVCF